MNRVFSFCSWNETKQDQIGTILRENKNLSVLKIICKAKSDSYRKKTRTTNDGVTHRTR